MDRLPVERILFGALAALVVLLAARAVAFKPGNPDAATLRAPQITLQNPLIQPFRPLHLAQIDGPYIDPFGPAKEGLRQPYIWENTLRTTRTTDGGRGKTPTGPATMATSDTVHIPTIHIQNAARKGAENGGEDAGDENGGDEKAEPEFAGAVVATRRRADGSRSALVRPNAWSNPYDLIEVAVGMVWRYNGQPYTIVAIDDDGLRVRFADGGERLVKMGGAPAPDADAAPANGAAGDTVSEAEAPTAGPGRRRAGGGEGGAGGVAGYSAAEIQEALNRLTPAQRERARELLRSRGAGGASTPPPGMSTSGGGGGGRRR